MHTYHQSFKSSILLIAAVILTVILSACNFRNLLPLSFSQTIDLSIPDDLLESSEPTFMVNGRNFWEPFLDHVSRMELHNGFLRFIGTRKLVDGSSVPSSIDLYLGAENDHLTTRIIALYVPGFTFEDPLVGEINSTLSVEFVGLIRTYGAGVLFREVMVTEEALKMKIEVKVGSQK
jgi:hypothetical protein